MKGGRIMHEILTAVSIAAIVAQTAIFWSWRKSKEFDEWLLRHQIEQLTRRVSSLEMDAPPRRSTAENVDGR